MAGFPASNKIPYLENVRQIIFVNINEIFERKLFLGHIFCWEGRFFYPKSEIFKDIFLWGYVSVNILFH